MEGPIFIGGFQRSGTTLLRYVLDSHPNIACGPETVTLVPDVRIHVEKMLANDRFSNSLKNFDLSQEDILRIFAREPIEKFFRKYLAGQCKPRLATKTPTNCLHFDFLGELFPDAKFIHVIRDGRNCVCSLDKVSWFGDTLSNLAAFDLAAERWARWTVEGMRHGSALDDRYLEVRYEALIKEPKSEISRILKFLNEPWHDAVLNHSERKYIHEVAVDSGNKAGASRPIESRAHDAWRKKMSVKQQIRFARIAGELLYDLGYELPSEYPRGAAYKDNESQNKGKFRRARKWLAHRLCPSEY